MFQVGRQPWTLVPRRDVRPRKLSLPNAKRGDGVGVFTAVLAERATRRDWENIFPVSSSLLFNGRFPGSEGPRLFHPVDRCDALATMDTS